VYRCGFTPRCARENDDGGEVRIDKICRIIRDSPYGVHDISKTEPDPDSGLPRFNMPFELGLSSGLIATHLHVCWPGRRGAEWSLTSFGVGIWRGGSGLRAREPVGRSGPAARATDIIGGFGWDSASSPAAAARDVWSGHRRRHNSGAVLIGDLR
jgi:hypothetical protein